jgi:hypothetical protein
VIINGQLGDILTETALAAISEGLKHRRYGKTVFNRNPEPLTEEEHATQPVQGCEENPLRILQARAEKAGVANPSCSNCREVDCEVEYYIHNKVCGDWEAKTCK